MITGAGGFIASHCIQYFLENTDFEIIGIDSFNHKGDLGRLVDIDFKNRFKIYYHDLSVPIGDQLYNLITECKLDNGILSRKKINYIINMASDSAVERSTANPISCLKNNYDLVINMLEFARKVNPEIFMQISTDEVYGEALEGTVGHHEWDIIMPSNPYAASKAAQEAVAISYWRTYDIPVVITNTMNIIGEYQDVEKFLPKIIQKISLNETMPIYGDSEDQIGKRVYLDVRNKADALLFLLKKSPARYSQGSKIPDRWNICGEKEINNLELAQMVSKIMQKELKHKLIPSESARPGYDKRYALDGSKLRNAGWKPPYLFNQTLERVVNWYIDNNNWLF